MTRLASVRSRDDERGSIMLMAAIFIVALVTGSWALIGAGQALTARRDAFATAAAAARAAAQGSETLLRSGDSSIDPSRATADAQAVISAAGFSGSVSINGRTVTVRVTAPVKYAFPSPGLPASVTGSASAVSRRGVSGTEGG
jgi:Flp pilus assembly protein TadG